MVYILGMMLGGVIGIFVLSFIWEFIVFKRVMDNPINGKVASVAAAWATAGTIYGFNAYGGFSAIGYFVYAIPAALVGMYAHHRGKRLLDRQNQTEGDLIDTFR